jgi:hypothetical protein
VTRRLRLAALPLVALLALPGVADARRSPLRSANLWATINVCDTPDQPDTIGVRGSMPGTGSRGQRMYMRITIDYFDLATQAWRPVGRDGDSLRFYVGASTHRVRQGGMSFSFQPPATGALLLRGKVRFEWRRGHRVIYHTVRLTEEGHANAAQADPPQFSAATCEIKPSGTGAGRW